tara:strand:+ start:305 stop:496 length:192 start_codon:yes stop_codon:yes gene_type:complete
MKIKELIKELQEIEDKEREISIVIGNNFDNDMVYDYFEVHGIDRDDETSIEFFCLEYQVKEKE